MKSPQPFLIIVLIIAALQKATAQIPTTAIDSSLTANLVLNLQKQDSLANAIDSLRKVLHYQKYEYSINYYKTLIKTNCTKIDTTYASKDSIAVEYYNSSGDILTRGINKFSTFPIKGKDTLVQEYVSVQFFNSECLLESASYHGLIGMIYDCHEDGQTCYTTFDKNDWVDYYPTGRYKYDDKNRLILLVVNSAATFRVRYCYSRNFDSMASFTDEYFCGSFQEDIIEFQFWDD